MSDAVPATARELTVDVVSDVVCPWCYIGKKHLDDAVATWIERHPGAPAPAVAWHAFQLNPTMPAEGMDRGAYLQAKFGDPRGGPGYARVVAAAQAAGLVFRPEGIRRQPNTLRAHSLIRAAGATDRQNALVAALFRAYFVDGEDVGDETTLRRLAREAGLDDASITGAFQESSLQLAAAEDEHVRNAGIGGVPFFVISRRIAVSGAQGTAALLDAFARATGDDD
jgi:predicted DsbA family dithiol-disulfide isomerase